MGRKLYRFATLLMIPALALGLVLWLYYGIGRGPGSGWMHAKLALVVVMIGYHHVCRRLLRDFEQMANRRSHRWFRVFNEAFGAGLHCDCRAGGGEAVLTTGTP